MRRRCFSQRAFCSSVGSVLGGGCFLSDLGFHYWRGVLRPLRRLHIHALNEYRPSSVFLFQPCKEAGFKAQLRDLGAAGCDKVFAEKISAVAKREQLELALDYCRSGDVLMVTRLDRLARSVADLCKRLGQLEEKGADLRVLNMNLDTSTPTGKLVLNVLGSIAQFERELTLERQREGIAKAKAQGKYKDREPTARAKSQKVLKLRSEGLGPTKICKRLGISRTSVYRALWGAAA
jgi:DNA invertase Pin-like site-specific DNA recombinase